MQLDGGGWGLLEVDGPRWRWVHGLAIPIYKGIFLHVIPVCTMIK